MKSILIYTFRTFPYIQQLNEITDDIFVLNRLKKDILKLENLIIDDNFDYIIGIAKSNKKSVFETKGVNLFNKHNIFKKGKDAYSLDYPKNGYIDIGLNNSYTTSFCNWGIYNVAKIVNDNNLSVNHSFCHILKEDIPILKQFLELKQPFS